MATIHWQETPEGKHFKPGRFFRLEFWQVYTDGWKYEWSVMCNGSALAFGLAKTIDEARDLCESHMEQIMKRTKSELL